MNPNERSLAWIKAAAFTAALVPLLHLVTHALLDGLGANPIEKIERTMGYWALTFLMITLAVTPLRQLLGWPWILRLRRMLGLFAFFYAVLHFLAYLVLDQFFDWPAIVNDVAKRPYITVGFPAFLLLIPLAATSTRAMMRRLGGKNWQRLHRSVYLIVVGGVVHYWWLAKKDISSPALFGAVLLVLLGYRLVRAGRRFAGTRPAVGDRCAIPVVRPHIAMPGRSMTD